MNNQYQQFSDRELLEILSLSPAATAIYTTEQLIIQMANDTMLNFWGRNRDIIGMPLKEAVPELANQSFIPLLKEVWNTGITYTATDMPAELVSEGSMKTFYYDFAYRALKREDGTVYAILHTADDVTDRNLHQQAIVHTTALTGALENEQALNEELTAANEELNATNEEMLSMQQNLLELNNDLEQRVADRVKDLAESKKLLDEILHQLPAPVAVLSGPNQVIELTNASILSFWNKDRDEVIGRPMLEVFPELSLQPFPSQWKEVLETGKPIANREKPVVFNKEQGPRQYYVDYYYQPLKNYVGKRTSIMATVIDVTDKVESRQQLEDNQRMLLDMNDELSTMNEEMAATNEELITINEELAETREDLLSTVEKVEKSEARFRFLVQQAPVAVCILNGPGLIIESVNDMMLSILGNPADIVGKRYEEVIPYPEAEYYLKLLKEVMLTGKPHSGNEAQGIIETEGESHTAYFNYIFQPIHNEKGETNTIMIVAADVTEQKEDELRKNDFIGMVSHELKTPLTSLNGYTQILQQKAVKTGDRFTISALDKVSAQIKKMTSLINGFLNISRLESGKIHLQKEHFYMDELITELVEESRLTSATHEISIPVSEHIMVYADRDKIGSVISNLLSNAVKYSPMAKDIEIYSELKNDQVHFRIIDQGMGIKAQDLEKLFDRFYRVEGSQNQHISGFGIGLYLSAEIMERHEGSISATSVIGKGSTFYFSLPLLKEQN
ncbi:PAS domain S-box-containing protein [Pedobacter westerhofensis]|uniref:histidine kinase n=1 Tax=Pedobacter westerhofensis TaxID=425512 RepID=A0A521CQ45_9SPHI|nr:PAS domain-containing protein [Pedobacter westerhofensis]SMO61599.1 PAS domain S-box-containing protein [Pedobacter westerhofensis]